MASIEELKAVKPRLKKILEKLAREGLGFVGVGIADGYFLVYVKSESDRGLIPKSFQNIPIEVIVSGEVLPYEIED